MKKLIGLVLGVLVFGCKSQQTTQEDTKLARYQIDFVLNSWHEAAAEANFDTYFNALTDDAILLGQMQQKIGTNKNLSNLLNPILIRVKHGILKL